eukprot:352724-Chlamydomonas_euryale.AAC.3
MSVGELATSIVVARQHFRQGAKMDRSQACGSHCPRAKERRLSLRGPTAADCSGGGGEWWQPGPCLLGGYFPGACAPCTLSMRACMERWCRSINRAWCVCMGACSVRVVHAKVWPRFSTHALHAGVRGAFALRESPVRVVHTTHTQAWSSFSMHALHADMHLLLAWSACVLFSTHALHVGVHGALAWRECPVQVIHADKHDQGSLCTLSMQTYTVCSHGVCVSFSPRDCA